VHKAGLELRRQCTEESDALRSVSARYLRTVLEFAGTLCRTTVELSSKPRSCARLGCDCEISVEFRQWKSHATMLQQAEKMFVANKLLWAYRRTLVTAQATAGDTVTLQTQDSVGVQFPESSSHGLHSHDALGDDRHQAGHCVMYGVCGVRQDGDFLNCPTQQPAPKADESAAQIISLLCPSLWAASGAYQAQHNLACPKIPGHTLS
jgi:hypothetical protein